MTEKNRQLVQAQPTAVAIVSNQAKTAPQKSALEEEEFTEVRSYVLTKHMHVVWDSRGLGHYLSFLSSSGIV